VASALVSLNLRAGPGHECTYLPGRTARHIAFSLSEPLRGLYHALMDLNYRRSGRVFYRPDCEGCTECHALRLCVADFKPSRSQRRCWERNEDLAVTIGRPEPSEEKHALYGAYLRARHGGQMDGSAEEFREFLCETSVDTHEVRYRDRDRLVGVGIIDLEPEAMSAVYCYFDPQAPARSLGVFNVLSLIEACRERGLPYLYLGYWVAGGRGMAYKTRYRPHEILWQPGGWGRGPQDVGQ
jgi:arginyl-tRNA--protein-N-Asp/Glu arginylyltransferase